MTVLPLEDCGFLTLTIHSAKGKEWEAVFVIGLNEGQFPSSRLIIHRLRKAPAGVAITSLPFLYLRPTGRITGIGGVYGKPPCFRNAEDTYRCWKGSAAVNSGRDLFWRKPIFIEPLLVYSI